MNQRKQYIIDTNNKNYGNYKNALFELDADTKGIKDATGYRQESGYTLSRPTKTEQTDNRGREERGLGTNSQNSIESKEYSAEPSEYRTVENSKKQDEIKIENSTRYSFDIIMQHFLITKF